MAPSPDTTTLMLENSGSEVDHLVLFEDVAETLDKAEMRRVLLLTRLSAGVLLRYTGPATDQVVFAIFFIVKLANKAV